VILEARGLAIGYRDRVVGRGLDLSLAGGEVLALLGPNGGGKTTLLKTVLGLIPPLAGEVRLNGRLLRALSVRERARLAAYVPQVHAGVFAFTVEEVVMMGRSAHGDLFTGPSRRDRDVARAAIDRLGISHLAGRPYTQISGGERQLALIARALAQEPRVVVLDEPTASLDFGNQGKVMREIGRLASDGLAVVFSTHDPNHALRHAGRAMLIAGGTSLASGPAREVLTEERLRSLYSADVVKVGIDPEVAYIPG
jgi:iron complex transport system ATP-binding protein